MALSPQSREACQVGCKTKSRKEAFALLFTPNPQGTKPHRALTSVCNNSGKPAQNDAGLCVMTRFVTAESEFPPTPSQGRTQLSLLALKLPMALPGTSGTRDSCRPKDRMRTFTHGSKATFSPHLCGVPGQKPPQRRSVWRRGRLRDRTVPHLKLQ